MNVQRVRALLGPADPARGIHVGVPRFDLPAAHDITPPFGQRPVATTVRKRLPWTVVTAAAAAVITIVAVTFLASRGQLALPPGTSPTLSPSPAGSPPIPTVPLGPANQCMADLARDLRPAPHDEPAGKYRYWEFTHTGRPSGPQNNQSWWNPATGEQANHVTGRNTNPFVFTAAGHIDALLLRKLGKPWVEFGFIAIPAFTDPHSPMLSLPPETRRAALRTLATTPGVTCAGQAQDPLGRTGLAITATIPSSMRPGTDKDQAPGVVKTLILDQQTGDILAYVAYKPGGTEVLTSIVVTARGWRNSIG
ncbi:hypothetical protein [Longispora albida]|uniref:hypothetical protein n=1 Tax=Longispora albida TaxID=203523 RepID=UPI00035FF5C4|nr:hypothetical protein [Longispora albida]